MFNIYITNGGNFDVERVENSPTEFWTKLKLFLPTLEATGECSLEGNSNGVDVKKSGKFR
jgi:hypothetical protein